MACAGVLIMAALSCEQEKKSVDAPAGQRHSVYNSVNITGVWLWSSFLHDFGRSDRTQARLGRAATV
jgi:hypothetical protein